MRIKYTQAFVSYFLMAKTNSQTVKCKKFCKFYCRQKVYNIKNSLCSEHLILSENRTRSELNAR